MMYVLLDAPQSTVHVLRSGFDGKIPRMPIFVIPYLIFLPWLYGTLICSWFKNRSFRQLSYSFIIINLIAFYIYLTFQTVVPRDPITSHDFFSNVLQFVYNNDLPYAGFPSLHAALSTSIATYFVLRRSKWSWAAIVMAGLIVISTLFTKQHFVLDAVGGVGLGSVVTWCVFRIVGERTRLSSAIVKL
jgi:membrane-associated phospholipid phosphatase